MEEQQRLEKGKRKGGPVLRPGVPYPPINITVLSSQSSAPEMETSASKMAGDPIITSPLDIPGPRDIAVKEYGEWQQPNIADDDLKAAFRQACDVTLEDGLDLKQVYKDQDPEFFIDKGIKKGIARRFVEDIPGWVENVKKVMPIYEII